MIAVRILYLLIYPYIFSGWFQILFNVTIAILFNYSSNVILKYFI